MSFSQHVVEEENRAHGRVIPAWRFYVAVAVTFALGGIAYWVHREFGGWWQWLVYLLAAIEWEMLLGRYRKRDVR